jgi:adenylate kinase family enzyme
MDKRIIVFGNSGSGKSTIAKKLCQKYNLTHLDLDILAWLPSTPPQRMPVLESKSKINLFLKENDNWVIEGCYTDLIELVIPNSTEAIFMNLPIEMCIKNARNRPWEPHKYKSKAVQDENLEMLLKWIKDYVNRTDTFSESSHKNLFEKYQKI